MKIGILQTGNSPDEMIDKHGDYDQLMVKLLKDRGFEFKTYPVLNGVLPQSPDEAEGWLITGSRHGAYEPHAWIPPLEDFLRKAYAAGVPIVGICFGHQILAQALGGKVEKFGGGWSVGVTEYETDDGKLRLIGYHQDQVVEPPKDARVIGQTDFCKYAMLAYGDRALSVQPHPEFSTDFLKGLIAARRKILPREIAEAGLATAHIDTDSDKYAQKIADFFLIDRDGAKAADGDMAYSSPGTP